MFYEPKKNNHRLAHNPFKSCVLPRPIGWISTVGADGVANLAPYSQFQNLTFDPPYVMFAANQTIDGRRKDTAVNAEQTGEFVYNMATDDLKEAINLSSQQVPPEVDEFELAGVAKAPSKLVKAPRVAESPINFECSYHQSIRLPGNGTMGTVDVIIGQVIGIHIKDEFIQPDGKLNISKLRPLARLGYYDYTIVESHFEMLPPHADEKFLAGMEGRKQT